MCEPPMSIAKIFPDNSILEITRKIRARHEITQHRPTAAIPPPPYHRLQPPPYLLRQNRRLRSSRSFPVRHKRNSSADQHKTAYLGNDAASKSTIVDGGKRRLVTLGFRKKVKYPANNANPQRGGRLLKSTINA